MENADETDVSPAKEPFPKWILISRIHEIQIV